MTDNADGLTYSEAGVDIDAADAVLKTIKDIVQRTYDDNVLYGIGPFGAMYNFDMQGLEQPVLVSSVDSVGTKLKLAFMTGIHDTVGIDIVSHCVNDILVQGARPLFFLDYLAVSRVEHDVVVDIIKGLAVGCRYAGCSLIGGEIAELRDMYHPNEYDLAGTIVGVVDRKKIVDGARIQEGDMFIGLKSSGLHTNGYSLARKICFDVAKLRADDDMPGVGRSVGEALLEPHRSYAKVIQLLAKIVDIKGMAHITGGGITGNLPRTLPDGLGGEVDLGTWEAPAIFRFLRDAGRVAQPEMMRTFNMGVGYIVVVTPEDAERAVSTLRQAGEEATIIGRVVKGEHKINYTGSVRYAS